MSKKKNDERSFVFYRSFYDVVNLIPDAAMRCRAYTAICDYAFYGVEPAEDEDVLVKMVFTQAKPQIDANNKRRENASAGGIAKKKMQEAKRNAEAVPTVCQTGAKDVPNANGNVNENENKNENENENQIVSRALQPIERQTAAQFTPPTIQAVQAYIAERSLGVDAERFVDYYTANGWMVGKNKMKDWKAALRHWAREDARNAAKNRVYDNNVCMKGEKNDGSIKPKLGLCL